jgi:hypothetical protein
MTADLGTGEKKDEYVNLDQLKSLILVQRAKLNAANEQLEESTMEKYTL